MVVIIFVLKYKIYLIHTSSTVWVTTWLRFILSCRTKSKHLIMIKALCSVPNFSVTSALTFYHVPTRHMLHSSHHGLYSSILWLFTSPDIWKSFLLVSKPFLRLLYNSYLFIKTQENINSSAAFSELEHVNHSHPVFSEHFVQTYVVLTGSWHYY